MHFVPLQILPFQVHGPVAILKHFSALGIALFRSLMSHPRAGSSVCLSHIKLPFPWKILILRLHFTAAFSRRPPFVTSFGSDGCLSDWSGVVSHVAGNGPADTDVGALAGTGGTPRHARSRQLPVRALSEQHAMADPAPPWPLCRLS